MPYLQLNDHQFPLPPGDATIGAFEGATVRLPSGPASAYAVVTVAGAGVVIRRGTPDAEISVNGVQLGLEPSPLLHGDRVEIAGHELRLGDDQKGGSTQFVSAADVAALVAGAKAGAPKKPTTATGGRLVSLVDGREYTVADTGLTFGREVGNDVVLASSEVSRKHATIAPAADGYVLTDHSTNGVWINGTRVAGTQLLGRGDVLHMGSEEFRFYADVAKPAPVVAAVESAPAPTVAPRQGRAPLATLEIKAEGPLKGMQFDLHAALTNIGRGEHNDIAIRDESISDSHAKLQKRADGWWVVDQGSTNGTYVGGRRVQGEQRLEGAPDLRFGGIKMTFRPAAQAGEVAGSTRAIAAVNTDAARRTASPKTAAKRASSPAGESTKKSGCGAVIAIFLSLAGAGAGLLAFLLTMVR